MKQTYRVVSGLIALGVLVQAAAIAVRLVRRPPRLDNGLVIDKNYDGNAGHGAARLRGHVTSCRCSG